MEFQWAYKRMSSQPRLPLPGHRPRAYIDDLVRSTPDVSDKYRGSVTPTSSTDFTKRVSNFVVQNPEGWEDYILNNTKLETLKKWVTKKKAEMTSQSKGFLDPKLNVKFMDTNTEQPKKSGKPSNMLSLKLRSQVSLNFKW